MGYPIALRNKNSLKTGQITLEGEKHKCKQYQCCIYHKKTLFCPQKIFVALNFFYQYVNMQFDTFVANHLIKMVHTVVH